MTEEAPSLSEALEAFQAGRLADAEAHLRRAVAQAPRFIPALQLLGTALSASGRAGEALEWFDRAAALEEPSPALLHNRAQALFELARFDEARGALERAVAASPGMHPAWNLLGNVHAALGMPREAEAAYDRAIALRPEHSMARFNRAVMLHRQGRLEEAIRGYEETLGAQPALRNARDNLADALHALGMEQAKAQRFAEAAELQRKALALRPAYSQAQNDLGVALTALGRPDEARACFEAILAREPANPDALTNLGFQHAERGEDSAARSCYERAIAADPRHVEALNNLAQLEQDEGRRVEAMALYARALQADPSSALSAFNLALLQLGAFDFERGWDGYELRFDTVPPTAARRKVASPPLAAGELGEGLRLAIWNEQGVGDGLLYSTLLPELAGLGQRFVFQTDRRLVAAYRRAHPEWEVVSREESETAFASCERNVGLASLPRLLRRSQESFSRQPRFVVAADAARAAEYRRRLSPDGETVVGISWRSFQPARRGRLQIRKSAPLQAFLEMTRLAGTRFVDLQYGDTAAEREEFARRGGRLERLEGLDLFNDLDGVLAAIAACDTVLTTSNVTAHLAGALGKRTVLVYLAANPPFHYWATDASGRSLWYPSMRIATGAAIDSWEKALALAAQSMTRQ